MSDAVLAGVRVLDLAGEPGQIGGRILADLGAEVVKVEPPGGDPLRRAPPFAGERRDAGASLRFAAWNLGKQSIESQNGDVPGELLTGADIVIDTPGWPGALTVRPEQARQAVWVRVTPFGLAGPRSHWRGSDLGVVAASGNMHATGFPDRAPLCCAEPSSYAHVGPEIAFAALSGLASGRPQIIDLSMQETVLVANMGGVGDQARQRDKKTRRIGAKLIGMTEIWRCKDGWVSFGIRGGVARAPTYQFMTKVLEAEGLATPAWSERDWSQLNVYELDDDERRAIEEPLERYFVRHTMDELYAMAAANNVMLAPCNTPRELLASTQLAARGVFGPVGDLDGVARRFAHMRRAGNAVASGATQPAPALSSAGNFNWQPRKMPQQQSVGSAWDGVTVIELGAGAAGPIATRFFAEHGANVIRIESMSRPEFLRMMAVASKSPHGVEGSPLFNALNAGKKSIALNLKKPEGLAVAKRLIFSADIAVENFAPGAMRRLGLDYDALAAEKPDLLMVSSSMNGQTGPHASYPGFGSQGAALAGFTHLTGYADRPPVGPFGTITDSLAPRFVATCMAAALLRKRRTGNGLYVDVSQVEAALYTLAPWILDYGTNGVIGNCMGNRSRRAVPHGVFRCAGDDEWVAVAVWSDAEWTRLATFLDWPQASGWSFAERVDRRDDVERRVSGWTAGKSPLQVAEALQSQHIEAVPVQSFPQTYDDPQLAARQHFDTHTHCAFGPFPYERNGFRISAAPSGYCGPAPALGADGEAILRDHLGCTDDEIAELIASGGVEV